jgi:hypothetical protein
MDPTAGTSITPNMLVTAPVKVGGERYLLKSVKICYDVFDGSGGDKIDSTTLVDIDPPDPAVSFFVTDTTDRSAAATGECYTVGPPSPYKMGGTLEIQFEYDYSSAATDFVDVNGVFTTWVPG